ncbi:MAG TPA: hypothetical protein VHI13_04400 [Candidatus Kapabacteria bacterium]|nr:hypothetical protein [Candidatus Kapabacteria bacterium]
MSQPSDARSRRYAWRGPRGLYATVVLLMLGAAAARAQEAYRASWTLQDRAHGLDQKLAEEIIARANDWLTRENPRAPTARVDDLLRVTVVGEVTPQGGMRMRLDRIVCGSIPIDSGFNEFLDTLTLARLIRRDCYWRDETIEVYNKGLAAHIPFIHEAGMEDDSEDPATAGLPASHAPPASEALQLRVDERLNLFLGIGFDEIALPGFSAGRMRLGLGYEGVKAWGELPAPLGNRESAIFSRGFEGAYGLGVAFEKDNLGRIIYGAGGMISVATAPSLIGSAAAADSVHYYLGKSGLAYGIVRIPRDLVPFGRLRLKLGLGYIEALPLPRGDALTTGEGTGSIRPLIALELAMTGRDGSALRNVSAGFFGGSLTASWQEQFSETLGVRLSVAMHGLLGSSDPFLPATTIAISPVISIR